MITISTIIKNVPFLLLPFNRVCACVCVLCDEKSTNKRAKEEKENEEAIRKK